MFSRRKRGAEGDRIPLSQGGIASGYEGRREGEILAALYDQKDDFVPGPVLRSDHYSEGNQVSLEESAAAEQANKLALDGRVVDENVYGSAANQDGIPPCQERKGTYHS